MPFKESKTFFSPELLTDPHMPYEERRNLLLESSREFLAYHQERIYQDHQSGASGRQVVGSLTSLTDTLLRNLYRSVSADVPEERFGAANLIAIGGYGREELNPRSDIDILFFYSGKDKKFAETVSERMLYLLWDLGLEVGYSVRTEQDCLDMASRDITARTALLDARLLIGDESLYADFEKKVMGVVQGQNTQAFIREKLEENQRRLKKYGSSIYLLEPNIKEGEGGLRDLHTAFWISKVKFKVKTLRELVIKGVISEKDRDDFWAARDYLWRIRNELHYLSNRKNDQIHFEHQVQIAKFLGYKDHKQALAVEQFMQDYYSHASHVEHLASSLVSKATLQEDAPFKILGYITRRSVESGFYILRGELRPTQDDIFEKDPTLMMRAFLLCQKHQVQMSVTLKGMIRNNLHLINDKVRRSKSMNESFFEILRNEKGLGDTLRLMHHLQFLNQFIPEFRRIYCKVQHDAYHIYTVDIHTLFAIEEMAKLWRGEYKEKKPLLTQVADDIEKRELLLLAILFHDIGKGEGKDHSNKGADMVPTIARRLGLNKEDSQRLEFLVRHHLEMAHISQRRDLHDQKLIQQFSKSMNGSENLKMLYLLTFADLKAVGPDVWSEWKGLLLEELYEKAYDVLERGNFSAERMGERIRNRKRKVVENLEGEYDSKLVKSALKMATTRYLAANRSHAITDHLRVALKMGDRTLVMDTSNDEEKGFTQVIIATFDIPGLFSKITGVMAANGINILGAQIYTMRNGLALDILQVNSPAGGIIENPAKWQKVETDLIGVIEGRMWVDDLVRKRQTPSFMAKSGRPQRANKVIIDNEASVEYTVIDVFANDKVGLLYRITKTLKELGLYIGLSKISTKVDQVADTFYVQDIFSQKIVFPEKLEEIQTKLLACLDADT